MNETSILRVATGLIVGLCCPARIRASARPRRARPERQQTEQTSIAAPAAAADAPAAVPSDEITWDNRFWLSGQGQLHHPIPSDVQRGLHRPS